MLFEKIFLGFIQGLAEWLPLSSEGLIVLAKTNFFVKAPLEQIIQLALFLHLGTFFASLVYFRTKIKQLILTLFDYKKANEETKKLFWFVLTATAISGCIGFLILKTISNLETNFEITGTIITIIIALLLITTGIILLIAKKTGTRDYKDLKLLDSIILGLLQGIATLPGISRSGITTSGLLISNFKTETALTLSFIISMPIILAGNILLNFSFAIITFENMIGVLVAFIVGLITINIFMNFAKKINFGLFMIIFGAIVIFAVAIRFFI